MKLATFQAPNGPRPAVVNGDELVELPHADLIAFLEAGADAAALDGPRYPLGSVRLLAPIPRPGSIRDAMTFKAHVINSTRAIGLGPYGRVDRVAERLLGRRFSIAYRANRSFYRQPPYYKSNPRSVVGPDAEVRIPTTVSASTTCSSGAS